MPEGKRPDYQTPTAAELAIRQSQDTAPQPVVAASDTTPSREVDVDTLQTTPTQDSDEHLEPAPIEGEDKAKQSGAAEIIMRKRPKASEIPLAGILRPTKKK